MALRQNKSPSPGLQYCTRASSDWGCSAVIKPPLARCYLETNSFPGKKWIKKATKSFTWMQFLVKNYSYTSLLSSYLCLLWSRKKKKNHLIRTLDHNHTQGWKRVTAAARWSPAACAWPRRNPHHVPVIAAQPQSWVCMGMPRTLNRTPQKMQRLGGSWGALISVWTMVSIHLRKAHSSVCALTSHTLLAVCCWTNKPEECQASNSPFSLQCLEHTELCLPQGLANTDLKDTKGALAWRCLVSLPAPGYSHSYT